MEKIDFEKGNGLVPAIVQDEETGVVLMLGYMNQEAYQKTNESGRVTFYSRAKERLWTKGEESGHFLDLISMHIDCDGDTLLIKAKPNGPVCHKGTDTCFDEINKGGISFLEQLQNLIDQRKQEMPEGSYTTKLFNKGVNKIAQKVGEEAVELVIEAKDQNDELFLNESADLIYHLLVLLTNRGYRIEDVIAILKERHE